MKKYKKIVFLPAPSFNETTIEGNHVTKVSCKEVDFVNEHLEEGWELIEILTHRSKVSDHTAILMVLGLE